RINLLREYDVLDRKLDMPYPMEVDMPVPDRWEFRGNGYSLKDKNEAKTDITEHGNGKSVKSQIQSQKVNKSKAKPKMKKS
ncbi:hypothetical protein Tco_1558742, partial [Tanacetum coccineum]